MKWERSCWNWGITTISWQCKPWLRFQYLDIQTQGRKWSVINGKNSLILDKVFLWLQRLLRDGCELTIKLELKWKRTETEQKRRKRGERVECQKSRIVRFFIYENSVESYSIACSFNSHWKVSKLAFCQIYGFYPDSIELYGKLALAP